MDMKSKGVISVILSFVMAVQGLTANLASNYLNAPHSIINQSENDINNIDINNEVDINSDNHSDGNNNADNANSADNANNANSGYQPASSESVFPGEIAPEEAASTGEIEPDTNQTQEDEELSTNYGNSEGEFIEEPDDEFLGNSEDLEEKQDEELLTNSQNLEEEQGEDLLGNSQNPEEEHNEEFLTDSQNPEEEQDENLLGNSQNLEEEPENISHPLKPKNLRVISLEPTKARIEWDSSINNNNDTTIEYIVYKNDIEVSVTTANAVELKSLIPETEYSIYVEAKDGSGNVSEPSDVFVFTTPGIILQAPQNLSALYEDNKIILSWDLVESASGYKIYRDGVEIGDSPVDSFIDIDISPDNTYIYTVKSYDEKGKFSDESADATIIVPNSTDDEAPSVPQNLRTLNITSASVELAWDESTDMIGVIGYELQIDENAPIIVNANTYTYDDLSPNTEYTIKVRAINASGAGDWSQELNVLTKLSTPVNVKTTCESNQIVLVWDSVPDAIGYKIYRDDEEIADVSTNRFIDTSIENGITYNYTVKAYCTGNFSAISEPVSETVSVRIDLEDLIINSDMTLTSDMACVNLTLNRGTLNLAGHTLKVEGNIIQTSAINLSGGQLIVEGDLVQSNGIMDINGGRLEVGGDYSITSIDKNSYSYGILKMMNDSDYVLVNGSFVIDTRQNHGAYLTAGTLEIKGDFTQKSSYNDSSSYKNFNANGSHKVILSGSDIQTVGFEDPNLYYSHFNILDLSYAKKIIIDEKASALTLLGFEKLDVLSTKEIELIDTNGIAISDCEITGNITLTNGSLDLKGNSFKINGFLVTSANILLNSGKLQSTNLTLTGGTIDLSGGILTVVEEVIQSSGIMDINGGRLEVGGDYSITSIDKNRYSSGILKMMDDSDYVLVNRSFVIDTRQNHSAYLTAGTLEIKGDFTQKSSYNDSSSYKNFNANGSHKVILSGSEVQTVSFEDPNISKFNVLEISTDAYGIWFSTEIWINELIGSYKVLSPLTINTVSMPLTEDLTIKGDFKLNQGTLNLAGHTLKVEGNMIQTSTINLSGGQLIVEGDLVQSNGIMDINGGRLEVGGDYSITSIDKNNYGYGVLKMMNDSDYVLVNGDFVIDTTRNHGSYLTAGTLEVKGDFTQKSTNNYRDSYNNFNANGSHRVILSGSEVQTVIFEYPNYSKFNVLILSKPYNVGYTFNSIPCWNHLIESYRAPAQNGKSKGTHPATGNYSRSFNDMLVNAPGFDISFARTYNSSDDNNQHFGRGWTFNFEGRIENHELSDKYKEVTLPDGSVQTYVVNNDGTFTAYDSRNTLEKQADGSFVLTSMDQTSYIFNSNGYLTTMKDRYGNTVNISVDDNGKIQKITDQNNRKYIIDYENDNIKRITDPIGRTVEYEYTNGNLISVKNPEGIYTRYTYDSEGYLSEIKNQDGTILEAVIYHHMPGDNQHKVNYTVDGHGNKYTYSYDNIAGKTTITDNNGRQSVKWYDSSYNITNSVDAQGRNTNVEFAKDENGINRYWEEKAVVDRNGNKTQYERDDRGNITKIINPDQSYKEMVYDSKNNLIKEKDESGNKTFYIYDSQGIYLQKTIQPLDGVTEYVDGTSNTADFAITNYTYYTDAERQKLGYRAIDLVKSITDPEGNITTYTYDSNGNLRTIKDPETGKVTTYEHNEIGWLKAEVSPQNCRTEYDYDNNGRIIRTILAKGETSRVVYNNMGQISREISPELYNPSLDNTVKNLYLGNHGTQYTYHPNGTLWISTDAEGNQTIYTYDVYGNVKTETKPNGAIYTYEYDIMNRLSKVWFKENSSSNPVVLEEYQYAILTNKNTQTTHSQYINNNDKLTTIYTYDYAGRIISQKNPDNTVLNTVYNPNGTVKYSTDAGGSSTYYKYDGLNRQTEQWVPAENSNGIKYSHKKITYDKAGRQKQIYIGKTLVALYDVPDSFAITTFDYYKNGLLKAQTDDEGRRFEYFYDDDGNLKEKREYVDASTFITTEYENNHFGKPTEERRIVRKGDIYGSDFDDNGSTVIRTSFKYDKNGNVKALTSHDGIVTTYGYDNLNRQTMVSMPGVNEYGKAIEISTITTYDWQDNIISTCDANGNYISYTYDQRGFLKEITTPDGYTTGFWYDRGGRQIAEVSSKYYISNKPLDEMNRKEYALDSMGRVITETEIYYDELKIQWITFISKAYKYDANGNVIKELDALGYQAGNGTTADSKINSGYGTVYTYNLRNQVTSIRDSLSNQTLFAYDAQGRQVRETNAKGHIKSYEYDNAGNLLTASIQKNSNSPKQVLETNRYDLLGQVVSKKDGNGNTTLYEYNALNQLSKVYYPFDETIPLNVVVYQYDIRGNLKLQENKLGIQDVFEYDNQGRQISATRQKRGETDSTTTYAKYDPTGNVRFTIDGNSVVTENTYDNMNRLKTTKTIVSGKEHITSYEYDANGNIIVEKDWLNNAYKNIYDPLNRLIEKRDPYKKTIQKLEYNNNHAQVNSWDALGNLTQYEYDRNNRLVNTIDPEGNETSLTYDQLGNIITKKDGNKNITRYSYNELNLLENVVNAKGEPTIFTYDLNGNMLTQTDGKGNTSIYEYNSANLVSKRIDSGGRIGELGSYTYHPSKIESYTYNQDGTLKTKTDRNGIKTYYTYDCYGRLTKKIAGDIQISYTYDGNGNQLTVTDNTGTTTRTYDEFNRVLTKFVPNVGIVSYEYDIIGIEEGCVAEKSTDPKGNITTKIFDRAGRLSSVIDGTISSKQKTIYEYYDNGNTKSVTYPTGIKEEYTYYPDNTLWTLTNKKADGTVLDIYTYTYDNANNQKTKYEVIGGVIKGTTTYTYDTLNRLETITEPNGRKTSYTYDRAGNRLTETITLGTQSTKNTYLYNEQNRLMEITTRESGVLPKTTKFDYDNNGNQLTTTTISYLPDEAEPVVTIVASNTYDRLNQLVKTVTTDGSSIINTYNGEGLRVSKTSEGRTTYFLYEYDKVVLELYSSGAQKARNLHGTNLLMRTVGYESYYYLYNGHADVTALVNKNGNIAATYYYDAFGNILEQTGDVDNNITYSGYQYDEETGLYYLNARMYDPKIARFLQEDTYRGNPNDPLSLNLYTYCHNNPIVYWDPTGHKSVPVKIDEYKKDLRYYNERLNSKDVCTYEKDYMLALKGKTENNLLSLIENSSLDLLEQDSEEYALKNNLKSQNKYLNVHLPSADQKKVIQNIQNSKNSYLTSMYEGMGKTDSAHRNNGQVDYITVEKISDLSSLSGKQGYHKIFIKEINSFTYIYITNSNEQVTFGVGAPDKHERVSTIANNSDKNPIVVTNAGFFFTRDPKTENNGVVIVNGVELDPVQTTPNNHNYNDLVKYANTFILWKDGTSEIKRITTNDLEYIKQNSQWAIGAGYSLVQDGNVVVTKDNKTIGNSWYSPSSAEPRTMLGANNNGNFISVVIDGRGAGGSKGATSYQQAQIMNALGANNAINFDGGGSSTFWYDGSVRNKPSDGSERAIGSVMMIVPK